MNRIRFLLFAFAAVCMLALPVCADPLIAHLELTGITNPDPTIGSDYTSPYVFTVDGKPDVLLVCVDVLHGININDSWDAYVAKR